MAVAVLQVNHTTVPSAAPYYMGTGGRILPKPPAVVRQNGLGWDVPAGYASLEWSWDKLTITDYLWWNTVLLGQASQQFSHAYLYDFQFNLTTYSNCVVHRPTYEYVDGDTVYNVKLTIDMLI